MNHPSKKNFPNTKDMWHLNKVNRVEYSPKHKTNTNYLNNKSNSEFVRPFLLKKPKNEHIVETLKQTLKNLSSPLQEKEKAKHWHNQIPYGVHSWVMNMMKKWRQT